VIPEASSVTEVSEEAEEEEEEEEGERREACKFIHVFKDTCIAYVLKDLFPKLNEKE
jgi:hypothetical protein